MDINIKSFIFWEAQEYILNIYFFENLRLKTVTTPPPKKKQ